MGAHALVGVRVSEHDCLCREVRAAGVSMTPVHTMQAKQQAHHSRHILNMQPRKHLPSDVHTAMHGLASSALDRPG